MQLPKLQRTGLHRSAEDDRRKKKIAMWIGYVGTGYKGLQIHPGHPTVEADLEAAIYKAGGILDSNYGHHKKVSWARSSRTDKGVHSLDTVISMKMELPSDAWQNDPCGADIADKINLHLPSSIRVFGVVPVSKSFRPRIACCERSYDYFLPPACVGIDQNSSVCVIKQQLEDFRHQLKLFEGEHPFHNYTIRRMYSQPKEDLKNWRTRTVIPETVDADESSSEDSSPEEEEEEEEGRLIERKQKLAYWLHETDVEDRIRARHFRKIVGSSCGDLEKLGDTSVLRVSVTGASFMVHQIRKMIGTAVAVTRSLLPSDVIQLSLCRHSRIVLPIAPSEGLILASSKFSDRHSKSHAISLSDNGSRRREAFWQSDVSPEIAQTMNRDRHPWELWCRAMDSFCHLPQQDIDAVRQAWLKWRKLSRFENRDEPGALKPKS